MSHEDKMLRLLWEHEGGTQKVHSSRELLKNRSSTNNEEQRAKCEEA